MEVILCEDVASLGSIGDVVKVRSGYARNFLLPRKLAVVADKGNRSKLEHELRVVAGRRETALAAARSLADRIQQLRILIPARAGDEGKLFGSITGSDIEKALELSGISVDRRRIQLAESIRRLGEYQVAVQVGVGISANLTIEVVSAEES